MHTRLQELIDFIRDKFQLTDFHLKRHQLFKEKNIGHETAYILNLEWFPNHAMDQGSDYNPPGTISIDIDIHNKKIISIIFVEGINLLETGLPTASEAETAIEWVEQETGLAFGRQFKLVQEDEEQLKFIAAADNIEVFPSGSIQLDFNEEGKLSLFSIHGVFPEDTKINWEPFALTSVQTKPIVKRAMELIEVPLEEEEKWLPVYTISSFFISNDGKRILSDDELVTDKTYIPVNQLLEWETAEKHDFPTEEIDVSTTTTIEAALDPGNEADQKITDKEKQKAVTQANRYLQSIVPSESGIWKVASLHREEDYIFATLRRTDEKRRALKRKVTIVLDGTSLRPINHIDNEPLLQMYASLTDATEVSVALDEAFTTLHDYIEVTPVYVYNKQTEQYNLFGKVDCNYVVDATTGQVHQLDHLH